MNSTDTKSEKLPVVSLDAVKRIHRGKRSSKGRWKQTAGRMRLQTVQIGPGKEGKFFAPEVLKMNSSASLETEDGRFAFYMKRVFSSSEMQDLASQLNEAEGWEYQKDPNRGDKPFYIVGDWTARGHNRFGLDTTFAAGLAGKLERSTGMGLSQFLVPYASKASKALRYALGKRAPDLLSTLDELAATATNLYGDFHLFMCPEGAANMHQDKNDWLSFLFLIETEPDKGGELEIGGSARALAWQVGDAVVLDSSQLYHGVRHYRGDPNKRKVGIFIIQRDFLKKNNILC